MKKSLFTLLLVLLAMTACRQDELPAPDTGSTRLTLNLQPQCPTTVTRVVDENALLDANLYIYREGESRPFAHYYTTDPYFVVDIEPAVYTFYAIGNAHRDMGPLTRRELVESKEFGYESDGTLLMTAEETENIDFSTYLLKLKLYRRAARIAYNVTVAQPALEAGIRIRSVQLCNAPDTAPLYGKAENAPTDTGYGTGEECPAEEGGATAMGTFYMLPNEQGIVQHIVSQDQKNRQNAPTNATYLRIRCEKRGATLEYLVYLGANNTTDFNVRSNEAHTYDVTIWSDDHADTRITRYLLECEDNWPEGKYRSVTDKGVLAYTVENTTDHELAGRLTVVQGEAGALTVVAGGAGHNAPYEFAGEGSGRLELTYAPLLIREGKNSRLEYRAELADETGQSVTYTFTHEFANRVEVYNPKGKSIDQVTVEGALDQNRTTERVAAWCYEGGCDVAIEGENFEGWYADAEYTRRLSAEKAFHYVPTAAESRIYAKFKMPETEIVCHEEVKNSTYMNNVNTVDLTVADYTGQVVVKAICERGGLFTAGAEQTVQAEAGKRVRLPEKIIFVPEEAGEVSYVIEVYLPDGTKIGQTEVANTITATKLAPNIRVYYAEAVKQGGSDRPWYGYNKIYADVSFTPQLDYPAPLAGKRLLEIQLLPKCSVTEVEEYNDTWDEHVQYLYEQSITGTIQTYSFDSFEAEYPANNGFSTYCLMDIETYHRFGDDRYYQQGAVFNPYTEGYDQFFLPSYDERFSTNVANRIFIYYRFSGTDLLPQEIQITNLYEDSDLQLETNFLLIKSNITNELN